MKTATSIVFSPERGTASVIKYRLWHGKSVDGHGVTNIKLTHEGFYSLKCLRSLFYKVAYRCCKRGKGRIYMYLGGHVLFILTSLSTV
jgi:hypothetical protein